MHRVVLFGVLILGMVSGWGQSLLTDSLDYQQQISDLQQENNQLRQHNSQLETEIKTLKSKLAAIPQTAPTITPAPATTNNPTIPPTPTAPTKPPTVNPSPAVDVAGPSPTKSLWQNELSAGGSINSGNTNSYSARIKEQNERETPVDKFHFDLLGDFKSLESQTVTDRAKSNTQYDHQITGKLYGFLHNSAETDEILDLTYRWQIGPGLGYYLIKTDNLTFSLESGPAAQWEKFHSEPEHNTVEGRLVDHLNWQINPRIRFFQNAESSADLEKLGNYLFNTEAGFQTLITEKLSFRLSAEDRYEAEPNSGKKRNDIGAITSLVFDF